MMEKPRTRKVNKDAGISLIELIVVISIMAIMVGLISISISLMFSRDAEAVAKTIDDELTEVRMLSMSRAGRFVLKIDPAENEVQIIKVGVTPAYKTVKFKKGATLSVIQPSGTETPITTGFTVEFDKGDGRVINIKINNSDATAGVYKIKATAKRLTTKTSTVTLVTATGRHYLDK